MSPQDTYRIHAFELKIIEYQTYNYVLDTCPGILNDIQIVYIFIIIC